MCMACVERNRAYSRAVGAEPPVESRGKAPGQGVSLVGFKYLMLKTRLKLKR